jgi:outer membrane biosynthesis protein TonB
MAESRAFDTSLRLQALESKRLAWAFGISIAIHLLCFGTYELGKQLHIWERLDWPKWMKTTKALTEMLKEQQANQQAEIDPPMVFVEVNPETATPEPPKDAPFYSDKNSKAANPEAVVETTVPEITGRQTEVPKAETVPRETVSKLQPSRPAERAPEEQEEQKPKPAQTPGDLALAKPQETERKTEGQSDQPKPRTVKEALARQSANKIPGEKMKQEGGVARRFPVPSFDAKETEFGSYDAAFIEAVTKRWWDLLDSRDFALDRHGKVVLQFHLTYDGRITDMNVAENTVGEILGIICQKAVLDPAPFDKWPRTMRLKIGKDYREIQFTFYYY